MLTKLILIVSTFIFSLAAGASDYIVITNSNSGLSSASKSDIKSFYIGDTQRINGKTMLGSFLRGDSVASKSFFSEIVGMTPVKFELMWVKKELSGAGVGPKKKSNSIDLINYVAGNSNAIGFIESSAQPEVQGNSSVTVLNLK